MVENGLTFSRPIPAGTTLKLSTSSEPQLLLAS